MIYQTAKTFTRGVFVVICTVAAIHCSPAESAEKTKKKQLSTQYWMSVATQNQSIPGMSDEMSGMGGFMGKMMGGPGFGPHRSLLLQ